MNDHDEAHDEDLYVRLARPSLFNCLAE